MSQPVLRAPNLSDDDIRQKAENFLNKYNSVGNIPVPIEAIVEINLEINTIAISGLQNILPIDGFITNDFKSIYVDEDMYKKNNSRYVFTLAHEIGHMFLHQNLYNSLVITSMEEYLDYLQKMSSNQYNLIEYQADIFAGFILVPPAQLEVRFNKARAKLKKEKYDVTDLYNKEMALKAIARSFQDKFIVSDGTIKNRLTQDELSL